jgi:Rrf2 family transcriptional regulator, cysteine metabolism repressor
MRSLFKVPQKIHHGLLLTTELATRYAEKRTVSLQEIAQTAGISQGFLEQVAFPLRKAGIIAGRRGSGGGYRLAKDPARLTVADVLAAIEGPISVMDCLGDQGLCALSDCCANRNVWMKVRGLITKTLTNMTVAEAAGLGRHHKEHDR